MSRSRSRSGITLIEVLVAAGIISMLSGFAMPNLLRARRATMDLGARMFLVELTRTQEIYHLETGRYFRRFAQLARIPGGESIAESLQAKADRIDWELQIRRRNRTDSFCVSAESPASGTRFKAGSTFAGIETGRCRGRDLR